MTRIEESRSCGVNCGKGATITILIMTTFYGSVCLSFSLVARLYLKMYFCAAHVATMSMFGAIFVIVHHIGKVRWALGLPPVGFYTLQVTISLLTVKNIKCCTFQINTTWIFGSLEATVKPR